MAVALLAGCSTPAATGVQSRSPEAEAAAPSHAVSASASASPRALSLEAPDAVAVGPNGDLYVSECTQYRVLRLAATGELSIFAGTGVPGTAGDGGPATDARLDCPSGLAADAQGNVFIGEHFGNRVRRVDPSGVIATVAGGGASGFNAGTYAGDGGPATEASLNEPGGIGVDDAGNLYIADRDNHRIRKVDTAGIITTVAGNGNAGSDGDGGPAVDAELGLAAHVAVDAEGGLYIVDVTNPQIRRVGTDGIIRVVAGTPMPGFSGDGGPATAAQLNAPDGIAIDAAGNVYISDLENHRIRRVDAAGIITTIAGTGQPGYSGDGGPAVDAQLSHPATLALDAAGALYVVDIGNRAVRRITPDGTIETVIAPHG